MGFAVFLFGLALLIWSVFAVAAGQATDSGLTSLFERLGASFATPAFSVWLFVFPVMVAAVYLTTRPAEAPRAQVFTGVDHER